MGNRKSAPPPPPPPQFISRRSRKRQRIRLRELEEQQQTQRQQMRRARQRQEELEREAAQRRAAMQRAVELSRAARQEQARNQSLRIYWNNRYREQREDLERERRNQQARAQYEQGRRNQEARKATQMINYYAEQKRLADQQAKKLAKPQYFKKKTEQTFVAFLENLKTYKFTDNLDKMEKRHYIIIGNISVGKSSLLNRLLGLNLPTGMGQTTLDATKVAESQKTVIFDSPGANEEFELVDINNLNLFHSVDGVLILYDNSLKNISPIIKIMERIKPNNTYLVRTKCDLFEGKINQKTLDQEIQADRQYLNQIIKIKFEILATSSVKDLNYRDNQKIRALLVDQA